MMVVVYHGLSDVQGCLSNEVLEFLPATVSWDLPGFFLSVLDSVFLYVS